jgi:hypothetical protein
MNCKRTWSKEFMLENFTATFNNQTYKKHRENILMGRQKSLLPLRVVKVERMIRGEAIKKEIAPLFQEILKKRFEISTLEKAYSEQHMRSIILCSGREPGEQSSLKKTHIVEFHKRCPATECRGFLNTQYKCGICSIWVCAECYEIKGLTRDAAHTCSPDNIASVKLKKKECRNCPECAAEIYKEIGCDQMWCTQCQTTFDWKTGAKLVNVKLHNPHYYEYLRRTQGSVPRDPDDNPNGVGADACYDENHIYRVIMRIQNCYFITSKNTTSSDFRSMLNVFVEFQRVLLHIHMIEVPRHTILVNESTNEDIDIQYLRKQIDEKEWKQQLQNREKQRIKKTEIQQILTMIVQVGQDILVQWSQKANAIQNRLINKGESTPGDPNACFEFCTQQYTLAEGVLQSIDTIRTIANESFEKYAKLYKCQAPYIDARPLPKKAGDTLPVWEFNLRHKYIA